MSQPLPYELWFYNGFSKPERFDVDTDTVERHTLLFGEGSDSTDEVLETIDHLLSIDGSKEDWEMQLSQFSLIPSPTRADLEAINVRLMLSPGAYLEDWA